MGSFICRQPNGKICRFSTTVDTITNYNMTEEEYIEMRAEQAREDAKKTLKHYLKPYSWIDEFFMPHNMTVEEFNDIKRKMEEKDV